MEAPRKRGRPRKPVPPPAPKPEPNLMDAHEAARFLGMAEQTLRHWRTTGRYSLPYVKVGRAVRYRRADLEAFLERGSKHA